MDNGNNKPGYVRGLDDKRRLLRFFAAKNHNNIVLRVVDVLEMRNEEQEYLMALIIRLVGGTNDDRTLGETDKSWWLRHFSTGWIVLPIDKTLEPMDLKETERLQQCLSEYRAVRYEKGEPNRIEPCTKCGGRGRFADAVCKECDGDGQIITFIEMSQDEARLAEGVAT